MTLSPGHGWGRDRVARLMRIAGSDGVVRAKRTTRTTERDEQAPPRHPDLIDRAWSAPTSPDQWWVADLCGRCKGFATLRSAWTCSPAASSAGG